MGPVFARVKREERKRSRRRLSGAGPHLRCGHKHSELRTREAAVLLPVSSHFQIADFALRPWDTAVRRGFFIVELLILSALILVTRCANYQDVFVDGKIYFVDADCYARMSRARFVAEHPGAIVRHHDFENFPDGTTPHTTAPLDYLIVGLAAVLAPVTAQPLDLAGAIVSPLLALAGGWFLWWWLRRFSLAGRYAALLVYSLSAILVHGTALGRPDHQSLLIVLLLVAFASEWILGGDIVTLRWGVVSGLSWGLALWVSLYEPLILLAGLALFSSVGR